MIYAAGVWRHLEELYTESKYTCSGGGGVRNINVRVPGIIIKYTRVCYFAAAAVYREKWRRAGAVFVRNKTIMYIIITNESRSGARTRI